MNFSLSHVVRSNFDQKKRLLHLGKCCYIPGVGKGGGGLPYITDGDARRNFQKQPLKVTILGVAPANFIP